MGGNLWEGLQTNQHSLKARGRIFEGAYAEGGIALLKFEYPKRHRCSFTTQIRPLIQTTPDHPIALRYVSPQRKSTQAEIAPLPQSHEPNNGLGENPKKPENPHRSRWPSHVFPTVASQRLEIPPNSKRSHQSVLIPSKLFVCPLESMMRTGRQANSHTCTPSDHGRRRQHPQACQLPTLPIAGSSALANLAPDRHPLRTEKI